MIPAHGITATYRTEDGRRRSEPVVAWDDDGEPLVMGRRDLIPASRLGEYTLSEADVIVAALPAGGWLAEYKGSDGSTLTEPIIGWTVDSSGWAKAIFDAGGGDGDTHPASNLMRVYHPTQTRTEGSDCPDPS